MDSSNHAHTVLFTGFPGFIGKRLLVRLAQRDPADHYVLLVEERMREKAEGALAGLDQDLPGLAGRCELQVGDITRTLLGLDPDRHQQLTRQVDVVWHLAAIYDLAVAPELAHRVNVIGTTNVLDFCQECVRFDALGYVSTCYVSGRRRGLILESELDSGQSFKNHYESTKFWAELEVQRRRSVPSVIFRPGIVVGDSRTGETDKYDGPYFIMQLLRHLPSWMPVPNVGRGEAVVNIVPVDFAVATMAEIFHQNSARNQVFQLADPRALRSADIMARMLEVMGKGRMLGAVPPRIVDAALSVGVLRRLVGVPKQVFEYFNHDAFYDSSNTQKHLAGTGITCPPLAEYLPVIYRYMVEHPR